MSNFELNRAKTEKNDEFYTAYEDIEKEIQHCEELFKNKTVYCNCDDPGESNFCRYFLDNFARLELKKLIVSGMDIHAPGKGHALEAVAGGAHMVELHGDADHTPGDFRSSECVVLLKQADIVCTNPPFSLFREYLAQLVQYDKKFLIIGNQNAITYKEVFPMIKDNRMWLGESIHSGDREFGVPEAYSLEAAGWRIDKNGRKYIRIKGVRWFTNMDIRKRHEPMDLYMRYREDPAHFPKYDNYDAIEVSKTCEIPEDYFPDPEHGRSGIMGVPITFMDRYCPEQFEIVDRGDGLYIDGRAMYKRIMIRRKAA